MKKVAGFCYILFRALFMAIVWVSVVAAAVVCLVEAMALTNLVVGFAVYVFLLDTVAKLGFLPYLLAVGMIGFRFLEDYLAQRKPVYLGVAELGAEIAAWLLKCDAAYIGVKVTCQLLLVLRSPAAMEGAGDGLVGFIAFLLADAGLFLFLALLLVVLYALCTYLRRQKAKT